ncbi:ion-translocating NADH:ferredoxin oxidoreductase complex Rnf, SLBB domain and iron-sulfur cluster-binding subunit RnfC [Syntrophotalea carbinolica DSM 2380]|uniref:Ion-translocating oxidoreductase complex subunit C n=1 Tax=Syntrophotalea carbinolica (strain DSM 2380 / NBRC 103641 / GraBd1) TaxID=338963 RepID=Q3A7W8_SYNC1|nr:electron transport complex subunit RsxC [Syntrophotalea carbinolica]ABA87524.1 ion-translocating NADH:ferredoxin oxidoreductase complex Rnf, SLBB domain and iron-sulfur cluster-binding subunit RnfC [Syntrophotalea carbinolica DSM 2380]
MTRRGFPGGTHPPSHKSATADTPSATCPLPPELVIPLAQHVGAPATPCVGAGQHVLRGQTIGRAHGFVSVPVHASTSGLVTAVEPRPHPCGTDLPAVVLKPDGDDVWAEEVQKQSFHVLTVAAMLDRIREAGVVGMGGAAFPSHVKLDPPRDKTIDTVIVNAVECEPWLTADRRTLLERMEKVLTGIEVLQKITDADHVWIGMEDNQPDAAALLAPHCRQRGIGLAVLPAKYPQGAERQLIYAVTGRRVPARGLPMDVGVLVQNVGTVAALTDAVTRQRPLIERMVTVSGPGVVHPQNLRVRIGTPIAHLLEHCGLRGEPAKVLLGGPMMGTAQHTLAVPVLRGTSGVLAFRRQDQTTAAIGSCVRCGRCVAACPMHLMPTFIADYARRDELALAERFAARNCIECGSCSFVCPAGIPLVQSIRYAKGAILARRRSM